MVSPDLGPDFGFPINVVTDASQNNVVQSQTLLMPR